MLSHSLRIQSILAASHGGRSLRRLVTFFPKSGSRRRGKLSSAYHVFVHSKSPAWGMVPPTVKVGLAGKVMPIKNFPTGMHRD